FEEYDVGVIVAIGLLGSLLHTAASGAGQYLEIAEYEAHTMCVANELSTYPSFGTFVGREGSVQRAQSSLSYRTRDGWVNPFLAQTKEFVGMARVMGREEWIGEEWFMNARGRRENCEAISDAIQEWMLGYSTHEAVAILQENRVPMGPVASPRDVVDDEHLRVRGYFVEVESEAWGTFTCPGSPFVMEGTPLQCSAAPLLGSSNADVLGELLGFSDGDIQKITGIEREG
ncbi:CoA transferase, partial [Gordonibacter sp.]